MGYRRRGWVMEEFRGTGKIYEQTASKMFHIPIGEITKGSPYRARGKVASLACRQYGGAEGALISMGALNFVEEEELKGLVQSWRAANPHIVNYWYEIDGAVKAAVKEEDDKGRNGYGILPVRDVKDRTAVRKGAVLCKTKDDREPLRLGKC